MEININKETRFDVGDTVYSIYDVPKSIFKCVITYIDFSTMFSDKGKTNVLFYLGRDDNGYTHTLYENEVYKTEYEAKIALGNMM